MISQEDAEFSSWEHIYAWIPLLYLRELAVVVSFFEHVS